MLISIIDIIDHSHVRIFGDKSDYWTESEVLS